jgi:hypothetical protein
MSTTKLRMRSAQCIFKVNLTVYCNYTVTCNWQRYLIWLVSKISFGSWKLQCFWFLQKCMNSAYILLSSLVSVRCSNNDIFLSTQTLNLRTFIISREVILGGPDVIVFVIGPKVHRLKPSWGRWILRAIIRSTNSFGGEIKPSAPCRKILRHVKNPCRLWHRYWLHRLNSRTFLTTPCFASRCLLQPDSSGGWIRNDETRMGRQNRSEMAAVPPTLCTIPSRNSNQ